MTAQRGPVREKPALNETRPPAAIAKCRVVFRVMNAELNSMRCRHATSTADMPPDGFSIRQPLTHRSSEAVHPFCLLTLSIKFHPRVFPYTRKTQSRPFAFHFKERRIIARVFYLTRARIMNRPSRLLSLSHAEVTKNSFFPIFFDDVRALCNFQRRFCE